MIWRALTLTGLLCAPGSVGAEPCTGTYMQIPLPGATEVGTRHVDVPAVRGVALWQEGLVEGLRYVISADLSARVTPGPGRADWAIGLSCTVDAVECERDRRGTPPDEANALVDRLEACLRGEPAAAIATPPPPRRDAPSTPVAGSVPALSDGARAADASAEADASAPTVAEAGPVAADTAPCGLALIEAGPTVAHTLQRLLNANGRPVGPVDGIMGPRSWGALSDLIGADAAAASDLETALAEADAALCPGGE